MNKKISIIGAGNIGRSTAYILSWMKICQEVVLCDITEGLPKGMALDIMQAAAVYGSTINITGTNDYSQIANSDVIIVSAGMPRKPGMTRDDLIKVNLDIIKSISENIKKYSPNAFIIIITNPLDVMVYAAHKFIGCPKNMIVGMAGVLDGARFAFQISKLLNVETSTINPMVIGAHNDTMVVLPRYTTISGISLEEFVKNKAISQDQLDNMIHKTKNGGAEIVAHLGNGSAYFNPAGSSIFMADCFMNNHQKILSCSVLLEGEYGINGLFVGAPVVLGKNGIEKIIELDLNKEERAQFDHSIESIAKAIDSVNFSSVC